MRADVRKAVGSDPTVVSGLADLFVHLRGRVVQGRGPF